ncbi:MAG: hypothetical protein J6O73_13055 [Lachnospiraceae bacterium]|nr:hypothetical protein [Lachnospiraceae bacterium]
MALTKTKLEIYLEEEIKKYRGDLYAGQGRDARADVCQASGVYGDASEPCG